MLDSYTSTMCVKSWGRNTYARALVEVSSLTELMDHVVVAIPFPNGTGHSKVRIEVEYEWEPPRCSCCKIFDHYDEACPKIVKQTSVKSNVDEEGFVEVTKRKGKGKAPTHEKVIDGVRFAKPRVTINYRWQPVSTTKKGADGASSSKGNGMNKDTSGPKVVGENDTSVSKANVKNKGATVPIVEAGQSSLDKQVVNNVQAPKKYIHDDLSDIITKNSFTALSDDLISSEFDFEGNTLQGDRGVNVVDDDSDNEVDEYIEFGKSGTVTSNRKEASTSSVDVPHV